MIEESLFHLLSNHVGLSNLINARIYPSVMPQGFELPCVVFQRIAGPRLYSHDGPSGLAHPRYQFSSYADSKAGANAVAAQVRDALSGVKDMSLGTPVCVSLLDMEMDLYDPEINKHRIIQDYRIWHLEV